MSEQDNLEKRFIDLFLKSINLKGDKFYRTIDRKRNLFAEVYVYTIFYFNYKNVLDEKLGILINDTIFSKYHRLKLEEITKLYSELYYGTEIMRKALSSEEFKIYENLSSSIIRKMKIKMLLNGR